MSFNKSIYSKVLVIGSGPIVIGQAAEFDYAGTQACKSLREEGIETILVNSNPATIMTDEDIADKIYIEPLTVEVISQNDDPILNNISYVSFDEDGSETITAEASDVDHDTSTLNYTCEILANITCSVVGANITFDSPDPDYYGT